MTNNELDKALVKAEYATFNGLVITGKGRNRELAKVDAEKQADQLGTSLRKRIR